MISIHLMFLLILFVFVLVFGVFEISIHLMFLLIMPVWIVTKFLLIISIHLMFLLIPNGGSRNTLEADFNTSHVSINPKRIPKIWIRNKISIHLMFLLILYKLPTFLIFPYFNTSHVSINLTGYVQNGIYTPKFQYISCFY